MPFKFTEFNFKISLEKFLKRFLLFGEIVDAGSYSQNAEEKVSQGYRFKRKFVIKAKKKSA